MEWFNFEIKEVWRIGDNLLRGMVRFHFSIDRPSDGEDPVRPTVDVTAFIRHDATKSFESAEKELLAEARRLLSVALSHSEGVGPQEIRSVVNQARAEQERRWTGENSIPLAEVLRDSGKLS